MKKLASIFIMISVCLPIFGQESAPRHLRNLKNILKFKTTDQIMMALEPSIEMPTEKIRGEIKLPVLWLINNTFYLFLSTCRREKPDEKFQAFYGIPVSYARGVTQHIETIHHLGNITGRGATSRDALVDLVIKLADEKIIDPALLLKKLKN